MTSSSTNAKSNVVYQKILRTPPNVPPTLFLGNLVDYLQEQFRLPPNLPMVYEAQPTQEEDVVITWDSPLSSSPAETRLNVQVVGIFTKEEAAAVPDMAMVVVSKDPTPSKSKVAPMMQNLFADSETKILRALDSGLGDVQQGKIQFSDDSTIAKVDNTKSVNEAIEAEVVEDMGTFHSSDKSNDSTDVAETKSKSNSGGQPDVRNGLLDVNNEKDASKVDYAVMAAKQAAAQRKVSSSKTNDKRVVMAPTGNYAVEAAKRAAATRSDDETATSRKTVTTDTQNKVSRPTRTPRKSPTIETENKVSRPTTPRRFTISTPKQRAERKAVESRKNAVKKRKAEKRSVDVTVVDKKKRRVARNKISKECVSDGMSTIDSKSTSAPEVTENEVDDIADSKTRQSQTEADIETKRELNLRVHETNNTTATKAELLRPFETMAGTDTLSSGKKTPTTSEMEQEVMKAAEKVMSEIASQGTEMSAEELLQDVMKFGEEQDRENAVGSGFVSGAFEKAKEILQERKLQRDERLSKKRGFKDASKSPSGMRPDILNPDTQEDASELTAEEELKRIFQAGERLAEGRIEVSKGSSTDSADAQTDVKEQAEIDSLIDREKTISSYARSLDDELTELEVRINQSPGEELDGPQKNPRFDIFSGPEVYNPNVDPETAVNWPGALPGTKDVRLPKELDEAIKQAKFAADVLTKMKEVEDAGSTRFYVGDRELTAEQVENLRSVVNEAVEIGLVQDPVEYLAERSRLQMVVDELWDQPEDRFRDVASNFKDLLLSDNFVSLIQERLEAMADRDLEARRRGDESLEEGHERERVILGKLVEYAQLLLKEARALGAELEASQLEIVRSICQVAMDPSHKTEEETANALTDAVRDMRPLLDDVFVAYLKYAIAEEESRLARAGLLDDPEHNEWLFVLKIVQQGVYTELSRGINRYIEHIWYILRMETKTERRMLLSKIIDNMPTMDVRPFVQVVDNVVASLGETARGEFDGYVLGEMSNKLLQLHRDVKELLPPERIESMSRDADEWAANQKQRLLEQRKVTQQRLKASRDTTDYEDEIRRRGEIERM